MADYNASEFTGGAFGPTSPTVAAVGGDINFTSTAAGPTEGTPVAKGAFDAFEIRPIRYRMRGYYVGDATYEFWTGVSIDVPNPSGNPLINIVVDTILSGF